MNNNGRQEICGLISIWAGSDTVKLIYRLNNIAVFWDSGFRKTMFTVKVIYRMSKIAVFWEIGIRKIGFLNFSFYYKNLLFSFWIREWLFEYHCQKRVILQLFFVNELDRNLFKKLFLPKTRKLRNRGSLTPGSMLSTISYLNSQSGMGQKPCHHFVWMPCVQSFWCRSIYTVHSSPLLLRTRIPFLSIEVRI